MIRRLNLLIVTLIFMLLMTLPSYARSAFFFNFGVPLGVYPYYPYYSPYSYNPPHPYYAPPPPDTQIYGDLEIQVTPDDVKVYVDGRFIGWAGDFNGDKIIPVPPGKHVVGFRYEGSSSSTSVYVSSGSTSTVTEEFEPLPQ